MHRGELDAFKRPVVESFPRHRPRAFDVLIAKRARIGVLVRSDPSTPWDAEPSDAPGLFRFYDDDGGRELPLEVVADRLEWRFFVEYPAGSFDPILGTAHGWRATPRFNWLGVSYEAPSRVLGSVDR